MHYRLADAALMAAVAALAMATTTAREEATSGCTAAGLAKPPTRITLVRDPSDANKAMVINPECSTTSRSLTLSGASTTLNITGFDIETIVSYPPATFLDLTENLVTRFDFSGDTIMQRLSLKRNALDNLEGFVFPSQLLELDLSQNPLVSFTKLYLPTSLRSLNLSGCELESVRGLRLSRDLETFDLKRNKIKEIEVRASDVSVLQKLTNTLPVILQPTCSSPNATQAKLGNTTTTICVITDATFDELYGVWTAPPPLEPTTTPASSSSHHQLMIIISAVGTVLVLIVLYIGYRIYKRRLDMSTLTGGGQRGCRRNRNKGNQDGKSSSGGVLISSDTGERPLGFPIDYFEDDDVRFDEDLAQFRINKEHIQKKKVLARGGFGVVYLAKYRGMTVAMKQLQRDRMKYHTLQHFMQEIRLLAGLNHPCIVGFLGLTWTTLHNIAIVMEHMPRGDLYTLLRQQQKKIKAKKRDARDFQWFKKTSWSKAPSPTPTPVKATIAMNIASALVYLHSQEKPIIHRDLKSKNVLLCDDFTAKITDFGISRLQTVEETMTREVGTIAWIAPEVLNGARYTEKADIYSFGVLLTELDTCHPPYKIGLGQNAPKRTNTWIASMVSAGTLQPSLLLSCPLEVRELALKCMSFDPENRPSAVEIVHAFQGMIDDA